MPSSKKKALTEEPEKSEAPAEEEATDAAPRTADTSASQARDDTPRPWRVETFSIGEGGWGWRLAAANGVTIHESAPSLDSKDAAVKAAQGDDRTEGAVFHDLDRRTRS